MLYSETQFSSALLTLPLYFVNQNPLFATNVWLVLTVFLAGLFMYLLARYLSKGNETISILSGMVFAFAPTKISAMSHLQSLSIFYIPLIVLILLKYRDLGRKMHLAWFGILSALLFLASWYQMVFGLIIIGAFILFTAFSNRRRALALVGVTLVALLSTAPIAKEYLRFSNTSEAGFSIRDQIAFSSSIDDYLMPYENTPVGMVYYNLRPFVLKNSHNPDNYSYLGISLYVLLMLFVIYMFKKRKNSFVKDNRWLVLVLTGLFMVGFIFSLGPVLKIGSSAMYSVEGVNVAVPLPYLLVDKLLPQLSFIRAVGRANIISLFALCCLLALLGAYLNGVKPRKKQVLLTTLTVVIITIDLLPLKQFVTIPFKETPSRHISYQIPELYKRIQTDQNIDNILILRTQADYPDAGIPVARVEDVLWAGYHNKNIFNGYSGFEPPSYAETLEDFTNLEPDDPLKMRNLGLQYVVIDKELSQDQPDQMRKATSLFTEKIYEDQRYALYKI
jgi:hypothetical protein